MNNSTAYVLEPQETLFNSCPEELFKCCAERPNNDDDVFAFIFHAFVRHLPPKILFREKARTGRPAISWLDILTVRVVQLFYQLRTVGAALKILKNRPVLTDIAHIKRIPSAATFSRVSKVIEPMIDVNAILRDIWSEIPGGNELETFIIDSTIIEARETPAPTKERAPYKKIGRGKRPDPNNPDHAEYIAYLEAKKKQQFDEVEGDLDEYRKTLNPYCGKTAKQNSKGKWQYFQGYKTHYLTGLDSIPRVTELTGANEQDGMLSIPLMREMEVFFIKTEYGVLDAGYAARKNYDFGKSRGWHLIIDGRSWSNGSSKKLKKEMEAEDKERYENRPRIERANSLLKERFLITKLCQRKENARLHIKISTILLTIYMLAIKFGHIKNQTLQKG